MTKLPEVFVEYHWQRTLNFINYKLEHNGQFILKVKNNKMLKPAFTSLMKVLSDDWKKKRKWTENDEIKTHLVKR